MGTVHQLAGRRPGDERAFPASIAVGIGDDDTVGTLVVSEHGSASEARAWIEEELPRARFPGWVTRRRHGSAGAFIFGQIEQGFYVEDAAEGVAFEPDLDQPGWDADLVEGTLRWRHSP
ncbi:hypothetical protein [Amycolatopsis sp. NPDC059657]|uniref:hypothetical protein n=1 Tax=Amycolatopsis sp. NPDC059657 TaxID=3346899 RepID=UPI00366C5BC7